MCALPVYSSFKVDNGCTIATPEIEKLDKDDLNKRWGEEIFDLIDQLVDGDRLVIDFSKVELMSSSVLQILLSFRHTTTKRNIKFILCGLNKNNRAVFQITCLDRVFTIVEDEAAAIALTA